MMIAVLFINWPDLTTGEQKAIEDAAHRLSSFYSPPIQKIRQQHEALPR